MKIYFFNYALNISVLEILCMRKIQLFMVITLSNQNFEEMTDGNVLFNDALSTFYFH